MASATLNQVVQQPAVARRGGGLPFGLFVLVNASLFVRPAEVVPALEGQPIYEMLILACLATAFPSVAQQFTLRGLKARPISMCVFGLLAAVPLSLVFRDGLRSALEPTVEFFKVVLYYLLLVAVINSPVRLRQFFTWLLVFIAGLTVLALLQFHEVINIPALAAVRERTMDPETGEEFSIPRLCGAGIFANPNDLARILAIGVGLALYQLSQRRSALFAPVGLGLIGLFGYAMLLTHSRGGFLALLATVLVLLDALLGRRKALAVAAVGLPVLLLLFAGRQTELGTTEGSGQQRIQLWSAGLAALRESPVVGIGRDKYPEVTGGLGAHNSFVDAFVELGLVGGPLFLGACYLSLSQLYRLGPPRIQLPNRELRRQRSFLLAIVAGYAVGMLTSSRDFALPTYLLFGLAVAFSRMAVPFAPTVRIRFNGRLIRRLALLSILFLAGTYVLVRFLVQWR